MEPPNLTNSLMQTMPYNSWKKRCFLLRFMLDQNPGLMLTLQIVLGMIVTLHPCMSFAILTLSDNYDKIELSLIPLICLCIEALMFSSITLIIFVSEKAKRSLEIAAWHRNSIFSLLKDIYVSSMTLLSLILCIIYIDTDADKLTFYSVSAMTSPLMILFISSLAKCILLKTKKLALWCSLCSFGLAQTILLILKLDFSFDIDWKVIVSPLAFMFLPLLICSVHSALNRYQAGDRIGIFFSAIVMIGCLGGIVLIIILQELIVYGKNEFIEFEFWGWITISFLGVGYSRKCGGWVLSIIFGHLEVDYWNFRNPVKVTDASMRSKTV